MSANHNKAALSVLALNNPITAALSTLDDGVICVGSEYGTLTVLVKAGDAASSQYRVVASISAHAYAIRAMALSAAPHHVLATGSDDATIVIQSLSSLLAPPSSTSDVVPPQLNTPRKRVVGCHTLPITQLAWLADGTQLLSSSYDGYLSICCAATSSIVGRINVGFPLTTFAFSTTDAHCVFVGGKGVARVDLCDGGRIPLHGTLTLMLAHQQRQQQQEQSSTVARRRGVERLRWPVTEAAAGAAVTEEDDIGTLSWTTDATYMSDIVYDEAKHTLRAVAISNLGHTMLATWRLKTVRWETADGIWRQDDTQSTIASSTRASMLAATNILHRSTLIHSDIRSEVPTTVKGSGQAALTPPTWSLGFASWYRPLVNVTRSSDIAPISVLGGEGVMIDVPERKRSREEDEDPKKAAIAQLNAKLRHAQSECDSLAQRLKELVKA